MWKQDVQEEVSANICRCQEKECIFVATIHGTCWYLTEKSGSIVWSLKLRVPIFSSPCISNRHIILADVLGVIHVVNFDGCEVRLKHKNIKNVFKIRVLGSEIHY